MISDLVNRIQPSFTLEMTAKAEQLRNQGINVIDLGVGEPDFNTPKHIREAAKKAMDEGFTKYTPGPGMLELRQAICQKLERDNNLQFSPEQIIASNGAKHSLSTACQALFNPGDEVIIFSPYWVSFPEFIRLANAKPVIVETIQNKNFTPNFEVLESKISSRTRGVILNSPSNPTGAVWDNKTIKQILHYASEKNWVVISDECYEQLVYDQPFTSTEFINDCNAQVLTIQSLSKTYAMTGWRIGYCAGDVKTIKAMGKIQSQTTSCPNSIGQKAAIEALTGNQSPVKKLVEIFSHRRDNMLERLKKIPEVTCVYPGGAFYAFPDVSSYIGLHGNGKKISSSFDLSDYILDCVQTVTVAGSGFGSEGHIRLSYATDDKTFLEGLDRIEEVLSKLT